MTLHVPLCIGKWQLSNIYIHIWPWIFKLCSSSENYELFQSCSNLFQNFSSDNEDCLPTRLHCYYERSISGRKVNPRFLNPCSSSNDFDPVGIFIPDPDVRYRISFVLVPMCLCANSVIYCWRLTHAPGIPLSVFESSWTCLIAVTPLSKQSVIHT